MRIVSSKFILRSLVIFLVLGGTFVASKMLTAERPETNHVPVSLVGVHHLGADRLINRFWVDKRIGDNVGEGGGGGSFVCCINLPRKWSPTFKADVRWEVDRIIRGAKPGEQDIAEIDGIYRAQVPVEPYIEPGNFYVHFFPGGSVRIVVSKITSDGESHPIKGKDPDAIKTATVGEKVNEIFTKKDLQELQGEIREDKKRYGDWG